MVNNILIIGITGNGKSALANTLAGESTNKFGEKSDSASVTKSSQKSEPFEWQGKNYCVIDNIGFGDTNNISKEDILLKVGEGIHSAQEGINQVLFVLGGRFAPEQIAAFNLFKNFISESSITDYTTIVRTNFKDFRKQEKCETDRQDLLKQNKELIEVINSCKGGMIYVDNPPIPIIDEEEDSDGEKKKKKREASRNEKKREDSRKIVLDHLAAKCPKTYKMKGWDSIYSVVVDYIERKKNIAESDGLTKKVKEEELKKLKSEATKNIKDNLEAKLSVELGKVSAVIELITKK